jgi:hypothetical protein
MLVKYTVTRWASMYFLALSCSPLFFLAAMPHGKHAPGTVGLTVRMPASLLAAIDEIIKAEELIPDKKPNRTPWVLKTLYAEVEKYRREKTLEARKKAELARFNPPALYAADVAAPSPSLIAASRLNEDAAPHPKKTKGPRARSTRPAMKKLVEREKGKTPP